MGKQSIASLLFLIIANAAFGQDSNYRNIELQIGDTLTFATCEGENYEFIDLYTKTRFEEHNLTYDSLTGEGFYNYFFSTGDFDIKRLPCAYQHQKCVITAVNVFKGDDGKERLVIFATLKAGEKVTWIEAERAFEAGEVKWRQ